MTPAHLALVSVKSNILRGEADVTACFPHHLLVVHLGCCGDLTKHHHHASLGARLAGNLWSKEPGSKNSVSTQGSSSVGVLPPRYRSLPVPYLGIRVLLQAGIKHCIRHLCNSHTY